MKAAQLVYLGQIPYKRTPILFLSVFNLMVPLQMMCWSITTLLDYQPLVQQPQHFTTYEIKFTSIFFAAGADFQSVSTVITFSPVPFVVQFECPQILINDDNIAEGDETFEVQIITGSCQPFQTTFTVTIQGKS